MQRTTKKLDKCGDESSTQHTPYKMQKQLHPVPATNTFYTTMPVILTNSLLEKPLRLEGVILSRFYSKSL